MKLCIFSDIHANKYALEAALPLMLKERADQYIFLGDLCGYYFNTLEVLEMLKRLPSLHCVAGNHDRMFLAYHKKGYVAEAYTEKYGQSLEATMGESPHQLTKLVDFLSAMPLEIASTDFSFLCKHDYPDGYHEYLYPDGQIMDGDFPDYVFFGHTHYRLQREYKETIFINPGSIGQPRDGLLPSYVTVVLDKKKIQYHQFAYKYQSLMREVAGFTQKTSGYLLDVIRRPF